ncbi:MAG: radical SAM protein [Methanobrevibacter sp.]|jgi:radical SAM protein with 4Fe4S-binding SPASM domain|nr:radical SAM protein [Candidatus Methanovirga procula]
MNQTIFPVLKTNFVLSIGSVRSYIFDKDKNNDNTFFLLNTDAKHIFLECNGENSLNDILNKLSSKYNEKKEDIEKPVTSFILNNKHLDILHRPQKRKIDIRGCEEFQVPRELTVDITDNCNLSCKHCFNESSKFNKNYIDGDILISFIKKFKKIGLHSIQISGGEPFMHPDILKIIDGICKTLEEVKIITNGSLINENHLKLMEKYKNKIILQLTLNSSDFTFHDEFSGYDGLFNNVNRVINLLKRKKINYIITMCITHINCHDIENTAILAKELVASKFQVGTILNVGRAKTENFDLSSEDYNIINKQLKNINKKYPNFLETMDKFLLRSVDLDLIEDVEELNSVNCGVGIGFLGIDCAGNFKLCPLDNGFFDFGNFYRESISSILQKVGSYRLDKIYPPRKEDCGSCQFLNFCGKCIAKGCMKYKEIGDQCLWGEKYIK